MPKNQPTGAKKARAAARQGAKYTEALRAGQGGRTLAAEDLHGIALDDVDLIRNGLWDREGDYYGPDGVLAGAENWDYDAVTTAWVTHAKQVLAEHRIRWNPDSGEVTLPPGMTIDAAAALWDHLVGQYELWVLQIIHETRAGKAQTPPDGIRPDDAPGARWLTWNIA